MITRLGIKNFKSLKELTNLDLKQLTVLAGANSSGKSTVIQSILLISQTINSRVSEQPLVLNGEFVKLGLPADIAHEGQTDEDLEIGFDMLSSANKERSVDRAYTSIPYYFVHEGTAPIRVRSNFVFRFQADAKSSFQKIKLIRSKIETMIQGGNSENSSNVTIELNMSNSVENKIKNLLSKIDAVALQRQGLEYDVTISPQNAIESNRFFAYMRMTSDNLVGCSIKHFLPNYLVYKFRASVAKLESDLEFLEGTGRYYDPNQTPNEKVAEVINGIMNKNFETKSFWDQYKKAARMLPQEERKDLIQKIGIKIRKIIEEERNVVKDDFELSFSPLPDSTGMANFLIEDEFSQSLRYLGPLRDDPKPIYAFSPLPDPGDIGLKGEYVASVLNTYKSREIEYFNPFEKTSTKANLASAITSWLEYMGVLKGVGIEEKGKMGLELIVFQTGVKKQLDLTNVGVGVSQLLPILVMGLLSEKGDVLIFEQPEIHLQPKVQTLLGDFFLALIGLGRQCIVETHSEYLIKRLRQRIAEDDESKLLNQIQVYFVEKEGGISKYREVKINENGSIKNWPVGFFDESNMVSQQIISATLKRQHNKSK